MAQRFAGRAPTVARFLEMAAASTLGQAYLFAGPEGSGKELTALEIARLVNCRTPDACREEARCESCRKAVAFQHPDIRWICPAPAGLGDAEVASLLAAKRDDPFHQPAFAASSEVLIGDPDHPGALTVRSLLQFLRVKPYQGRRKVAVVADAHRMRTGAANAFLKMLEEPPPSALIILLTGLRGRVLPTINSRCQHVAFSPYPEAELADLLVALYGLPAAEARAHARAAAGDARRAARARLPLSGVLTAWAGELVEATADGRAGTLQIAAEKLHKGVLPEELVAAANRGAEASTRLSAGPARELVERRERAIQLCEALHLHYSEMLGCVVGGDGWRPRLEAAAPRIRTVAAGRTPQGLLKDIDAVERARRDIDRSLNIGLVWAVLFQELISNVRSDLAATRA